MFPKEFETQEELFKGLSIISIRLKLKSLFLYFNKFNVEMKKSTGGFLLMRREDIVKYYQIGTYKKYMEFRFLVVLTINWRFFFMIYRIWQ